MFPSKPLLLSRKLLLAPASVAEDKADTADSNLVVGEDSAAFDLQSQKISSWVYFTVILGVVLFTLNVVWIDPSTGFGKDFVDAVSGISDSPEVIFFSSFLLLLYLKFNFVLFNLKNEVARIEHFIHGIFYIMSLTKDCKTVYPIWVVT